jgi:hypothetical protein
MKKFFATAMLPVLALAFAACGGGYNPPPDANTKKLPPSQKPATIEKEPTGPSYVREFQQEYDLAKAAFQEYRTAHQNNDAEAKALAYAKQGTHFYKALWYRTSHEKNGHKADLLRGLTQFNRDYKDWKSTMGQVDKKWAEDPDYKAAKEAFDKLDN